ncbi:exonuclease V subunit gamma [Synechococcus sp. CB0101]|uniref:exodeoxyribonuclease V subunit gamma n=1 Tax=Synechococcus sp. CB0101 TaxID=232348 RepID=UPI0010AA574D|nr:exodeoxyribonuclease V subunit gamma [Synechococcus sp. CB0101]QCH15634.1 exonuclease V subunit gamma [Synechococcus sp. CB0101]
MLTLYRSNRAELLAQVLAAQLRLEPPGPLEQIQVVVNTWPTSRWLGEQIATGNGAGIAANLRFPFPTSQLRQVVDQWLGSSPAPGPDPWRAQNLVWPLLELLPPLLEQPEAAPLQRWLQQRQGHSQLRQLDRPLWQLARAIADAIDDYGLYRPAMLEAWLQGQAVDSRGQPLPPELLWQPLLVQRLAEALPGEAFGLRALALIRRLQQGWRPDSTNPQPLRLFGLSSLAPVQVELLQAISACQAVELYLLTPCRDLWQRRDAAGSRDPLSSDWLLEVPGLEARFGRLGAEFQQLLEGSGENQLGEWREGDLFFAPAAVAVEQGRTPTLLEQLQERLASGAADGEATDALQADPGDSSLEFHACPGRLRQLQVLRDRLLQLLAADPKLEPRDILVMTPQVEAFAPLVGAVFGDSGATGVQLPWRLTDRSQQSEAGISQGLLELLQLGGERFTASALERLLACTPLLTAQGLEGDDAAAISRMLQEAGFRWGLDGRDRGGDGTHSLEWALDRLVLGLVLPQLPGMAPGDCAPLAMEGSLEQQQRWIALLRTLLEQLRWLAQPRSPAQWIEGLRPLLQALFGDGGERAWELQSLHAVLSDWKAVAQASELELAAPVVAELLGERLSEGSGRFGHRSGALTISALEPMRAIPHKVVVLMGLDAGAFPRQRQRPGFHLLEQQRQLGDPNSGDQDRYVLLESLLSARQHLLVSWSNRDERSGEALEASTPVRQWLEWLSRELPQLPLRVHCANPLERANFLPADPWPPASCDRRLLQARQQLEQGLSAPPARGLAFSAMPSPAAEPVASPEQAWSELRQWIEQPQRSWLEGLSLRPREFDHPVLDRDALELGERERAALLRQQLDPLPEALPDWPLIERGTGLLPPQAAGELEVQQLEQRWLDLSSCLELLGEAQQRPASWEGLSGELSWRGRQLVLVHSAKPRTPQRLVLWLELLLACAAGQAPVGAALVGRDGHRFRVLERLEALPAAEAALQLEQLRQWHQAHRQRCWPLPPDTGWAYAAASEQRRWSAALGAWEGNPLLRGERRDPVQAVCFGADLPLEQLLTPKLQALALQLHGPLLQRRKEEKKP